MGTQSRPSPPTADKIRDAVGCHIPDLIAPELKVLFCGINPGLYSVAMKYHFARPGNRFWPALHLAGFTPRILTPFESPDLLESGYGIATLVHRATATSREVALSELVTGRRRLARTVCGYRPRWVAMFGVQAYRTTFCQPDAQIGRQQDAIAGAHVWLLPSPSGTNGSYPLVNLVGKLRELYEAVREV